MRALLFNAILNSAVVADRVYASGALGVGPVPAEPLRPYIQIKALQETPYPEVRKTARSSAKPFQVFVYDDRGSFVRIDDILRSVRDTVLGLVQQVSPTGAQCTDVEWQGISQDLPSAQDDMNVKYATFRLTSNQ